MARTTHDMDLDHHGVLPDDFIAGGTPADGDVPISNGDGTRTWGPMAGGAGGDLDDLDDVNAPTPADGDVLTWDATPGEWVAAASAGGPGSGPLAWSPVMADAPHVITTTGEPLYVPLVTAEGQAVLAQVYVE